MTCPSCGTANPARARFCATCGSPPAAGRKFIGDAVVAFGVPVVREDDALRAVRAAAATQDGVADLGAGLEVRRNQGPLVGRRAELQRFDLVFQRGVQTSSRHLLTVLGAAGVGKMGLVATAVDALGEAATALFGHCPSDAGGQHLLAGGGDRPPGGRDQDGRPPEQARAALDELLAGADDGVELAERVGRLIGPEASPVPPEDSAWAVRHCLEVAARRRPLVVVVIDDLHRAQPTLLDLLEQVVALAMDAPILLVAVARPGLLEQRTGWAGGLPSASTPLLEPPGPDATGYLTPRTAAPVNRAEGSGEPQRGAPVDRGVHA